MKKIIQLTVIAVLFMSLITLNTSGNDVSAYREYEYGQYNRDVKIVIDAGHGGRDGGVVGIRSKKREAEINLAISYMLKRLLENTGATVIMTRTTDASLCGDKKYSKRLDMALRAEIIKAAKPDITVSIHLNSYPDPAVSGPQVFYYPDSESGERLAKTINQSIFDVVDPPKKRSVKEADFFMLRCYPSASALIECGFMTNPAEEALLLSEEYQEKMAYAVFQGIINYLGGLYAEN